ncbi:unnamed protein product [Clonostachys byssicola]|uniref:Protein kinase domain-containing protein n=1 Tax=Clonostachys byssicola TaxID=160290 RepID=A0A9N9Y4Y6_9HYPO|nr:unnamed protein product [Clonostachys byssicola]
MSTPHILGGDLSELVRDSRLDAIFERGCTIHPRAAATRRENYSHEKWFPRQDPVGKGGMGLVYVEERERVGSRPVSLRAVKKIQLSGRPEQKKMIRRELEAMFKFSQPRFKGLFIQPYGWFLSGDYVHIAMEYYELGDLQKYLDHPSKCPNGRLPEHEAGSIASQILDALYVMHQHNFSHWDLKPANLLIKQQPPNPWLIKLGDFGISKRGEAISNFTSLAGTIDYMPPEHHGYRSRSGDNSRAVDMWAFGYTIFRVLTGQGMFRDGHERHAFFSNMSPFPDHILRNLQISEDGISFLRKLVVVDPGARIDAEAASRDPWIEKYDQEQHQQEASAAGTNHTSHDQSRGKLPNPPIDVHSHPSLTETTLYPGCPSPFPNRLSTTESQLYTVSSQSTRASAAWPTASYTTPSYHTVSYSTVSSQSTRASAAWPTATYTAPGHSPSPLDGGDYTISSQTTRALAEGTMATHKAPSRNPNILDGSNKMVSSESTQAFAASPTETRTTTGDGLDFLDEGNNIVRKDDAELFFAAASSQRSSNRPHSVSMSTPTTQTYSLNPGHDTTISRRSIHGPSVNAPDNSLPRSTSSPSAKGPPAFTPAPLALSQDLTAPSDQYPLFRQSLNLSQHEDPSKSQEQPSAKGPPAFTPAPLALSQDLTVTSDQYPLFRQSLNLSQHEYPSKSQGEPPTDMPEHARSADLPIGPLRPGKENAVPTDADQLDISVNDQSDVPYGERLQKAFVIEQLEKLRVQGQFDEKCKEIIHGDYEPPTIHERLEIIKELERKLGKDHIIVIDARCVIAKEQIDEQRNYFEAVRTYQRALLVKKKMFGSDDPRTLHSMHDLGDALSRYCKFEEAEPICREALQQRRRILGPSNIDTIESLGALAACLQGQQNFSEATLMFQEVVEVRKQFLGPTDKRTVDAMVSVGICLNQEGRVHDAEAILREALQIIRREPDSYEKRAPDAVHVLCLTLCNQSRVEEAEKLLREDSDQRNPEYFRTAENFYWLCLALNSLEHYQEAQPMWKRLIKMLEWDLGRDNITSMRTKQAYVQHLIKLGDTKKALKRSREVFERRAEVLGTTHPDTLHTMQWLGHLLLTEEGPTEEGLQVCHNVYRFTEEAWGAYHPNTLTTSFWLGDVLIGTGKIKEGREILEALLHKQELTFGKAHGDAILTRDRVAASFLDEGDNTNAEQSFRRIVQLKEIELGVDDPATIDAVYNLADFLDESGKFYEAEVLFRRVRAHRERNLGQDHPGTLVAVTALGRALYSTKQYAEAEQVFRLALHAYERKADDEVMQADLQELLAVTLTCLMRHSEAEKHYYWAWLLRKNAVGENDGTTVDYMVKYALYQKDFQQRAGEAETLIQDAVRLYKELLGAEHPKTQETIDTYAQILLENHNYTKAIEVIKEIRSYEDPFSEEFFTTMLNLGHLYKLNNQLSLAFETYTELLNLQKARLGDHDAATLETLHRLAEVRMDQGAFIEAMGLASKVAKLRSQYLTDGSWQESLKLEEECKERLLR